jgi:hypothetical protein
LLHYSLATFWRKVRAPRRLRKASIRLQVEELEDRRIPSATPWSSYAANAQHTADSSVASQSLAVIHWQTPVDLNPQFSGNDLLIHYGSPLITSANTVIVPVKTGATGGFEVEGINGRYGNVKWTQSTDYILPPHNWTPSFSPVLTPNNRLYFAGAGGTVYYIDAPDSDGAAITGHLAFYGINNYNSAQFDNSVFINTPITSDSHGDIYFGFQTTSGAPLGLQSGIARIAADGTGSWVAATTAANDAGIIKVVMNNAPALSNDGSKLYIAVSAGDSARGDLLELNSTSLATLAIAALMDVAHPANNAALPDDGTASTTVGPDGDVYFGVLENPFPSNNDRGWLLHFSGDLSQAKTSGAFGWDDTASIVLASMVPSYHGTSNYLLMTKYNNYAGINTGDGQNKIAILDPNATETDPVTGATVMQEVLTILGPTPDPSHPGGVREWCINSAVVDSATDSVLANSEDGKLYRWDLTTNAFTQVVTLTPGIGEAYTPTVIGVDGTVYAVNDAKLFAVGAADAPLTAGVLTPPAATEGARFTNTVLFHFTDADPNSLVSDFKASVVWGDGTTEDSDANPADVAVVANAGGGFDVVASHTYLEELTGQTFSVAVADQGGSSASAAVTNFSVADAPLTAGVLTLPAATEGSRFTNTVLFHFTDADPNSLVSDFKASVVWGDGTTEDSDANPADVAVVANAGGGFDVVVSYTYLEELTGQTFSVSVVDQGGAAASASVTNLRVVDAPLSAGALTPPSPAFERTPITNAVLFHFTDADPNAVPSDYTATVSWGDGTTETSASSPNVMIVANVAGGFDVVGSHTYLDEFTGKTFSASVADQGGATAIAANANVTVLEELLPGGVRGTPNQRWLSEVYRDLLSRQVDSGGLAAWNSQLNLGMSQVQIVQSIETSKEYRTNQVQALYSQYLHRSADAWGLAGDVAYLQSGGTVEQLAAAIAGSAEYFQNRGGGTNSGFLAALYQDSLGRPIDSVGAGYFGAALAAGVSRVQVAASVLSSAEYHRFLVSTYYNTLLDRPTDAGSAGWVNALNMGARDESIIASIASSSEFYNKTVS